MTKNNQNNKEYINLESIDNIDNLAELSDECLERTLNRLKNINSLRDETN